MKRMLLFALFALTIITANAQSKHALVIGIGKYPENSGWRQINGDRDADTVSSMLAVTGFHDIQYLKNDQATKKEILRAFKNLTDHCKKGDIVYIHFSGHGQQMKDRNGDEPDKLDESWIPYNACRQPCPLDSGENHLVDDELGLLLDNIYNKVGPEGKILVVADACHCGSSTRNSDLVARGVRDTFVRSSRKVCPVVKQTTAQRWILISACKDNQINYEFNCNGHSMGKLTYIFCRLMRSSDTFDDSTLSSRIQEFYKNASHRGGPPQNVMMTFPCEIKWSIHQLFKLK